MGEAATSMTQPWESFYVIVGSSAGALTGLQFVVLTMIGEARKARGGGGESIAAFGSPNVVHFCAALLVSAILSAPWGGLGPPGVAIAVSGALGVVYAIAVVRRAFRQRDYKPVLEDWTWHGALPILAYAALVDGGLSLEHAHADSLYIVGGATLLLVFIGIHNAWDTVMYITVVGLPERADSTERSTPSPMPAAPAAEKRSPEPPTSLPG